MVPPRGLVHLAGEGSPSPVFPAASPGDTQLQGEAGVGGGSRYLRGSPERFTVLANITSSPGELTGCSEIINN